VSHSEYSSDDIYPSSCFHSLDLTRVPFSEEIMNNGNNNNNNNNDASLSCVHSNGKNVEGDDRAEGTGTVVTVTGGASDQNSLSSMSKYISGLLWKKPGTGIMVEVEENCRSNNNNDNNNDDDDDNKNDNSNNYKSNDNHYNQDNNNERIHVNLLLSEGVYFFANDILLHDHICSHYSKPHLYILSTDSEKKPDSVNNLNISHLNQQRGTSFLGFIRVLMLFLYRLFRQWQVLLVVVLALIVCVKLFD
jgi:hypothetical protein